MRKKLGKEKLGELFFPITCIVLFSTVLVTSVASFTITLIPAIESCGGLSGFLDMCPSIFYILPILFFILILGICKEIYEGIKKVLFVNRKYKILRSVYLHD